MVFRKIGPCRGCCHWRDGASRILAGTAATQGECRRRVQTGLDDGLRPWQPVTGPDVGCSEHLSLPAPARLPGNCGDCRYWAPSARAEGAAADEGLCRVWAPRWSGNASGHAFPVTRRDFYCGDGVRTGYVDPEEDDEEEDEGTLA
jgi:hypothetical protein